VQVSYTECCVCHAVEASVVDRGEWEKSEFTVVYRWVPVSLDYLYPNPAPKGMMSRYSGPAVFRWVWYDSGSSDWQEIRLGETDNLYGYVLRLIHPSNRRARLRRLLDSYASRGLQVRMDTLDISHLGEILMSAVGMSNRSVRRLMLSAIQVASASKKRL